MKKEFVVERQGKSFILYAGLLDLAHQQGLKSIRTAVSQVPAEDNNRVAICTATVVIEKDGVERTFTGIGDAAPNNVAPAMQTCLLRMAETRAKARALRDAVNVGVAAFEELGDEGAHDGAPERGYAMNSARVPRTERPAPNRNNNNANGGANGHGGAAPARSAAPKVEEGTPIPADLRNPAANAITESQMDAIRNLCKRRGTDPDSLAQERFEVESLDLLTQAQGSELIRTLNAPANGRAASAA